MHAINPVPNLKGKRRHCDIIDKGCRNIMTTGISCRKSYDTDLATSEALSKYHAA